MLNNTLYPILQVSSITGCVFPKQCCIVFAETDITCYIHFCITNQNQVQNILWMTTLLLSLSLSHSLSLSLSLYIYIYIYILITYIMLFNTWFKSALCITTIWQYCYVTCYITIYIVEEYSNITEDIIKPICYITLNLSKVNIIDINFKN